MIAAIKAIKVLLILTMLTFCFFLMGDSKANKMNREQIKIAYISKDLKHVWFQQIDKGIRFKANELGILYDAFDASYNDEKCIELVKKVIKEDYDGLLICTTNQQLGAQIGEICSDARLPVLTVDDPMKDSHDNNFPHVGIATRQVGAIGGSALVKMAQERGFLKVGNRVHILELDVPGLTVFKERLEGFELSIYSETELNKNDVIRIDVTDGMYKENMRILENHVKEWENMKDDFWIICGANDDCALALNHTLVKNGFREAQIISCGIGGYDLSVKEFERGNKNYIAVMMEPENEGNTAMEMMYEQIEFGYELKNSTIFGGKIATADNYLVFFKHNQP